MKIERPAAEDTNAGRHEMMLTEAARLFSARGFAATTIRDIAAAAGISGGSFYYYFASKEEIFLAVHSIGIETIGSAVRVAIEGISDPWDRLEAAAVAHCEALLSTRELPILVSPYFARLVGDQGAEMTAQRNSYEKMFTEIVADLDLPPTANRRLFRLHVLGALNSAVTWYQPTGRLKPGEIGRQLIVVLRNCAKDQQAGSR